MHSSFHWLALVCLLGVTACDGPPGVSPDAGPPPSRVTIRARIPVGADAALVAAGDVDDDGDEDLVIAHNPPGLPSRVSLLVQMFDGTFEASNDVEVGPRPITSLTLADVDGDGDDEIVAVDELVLLDFEVGDMAGRPRISMAPRPWGLSPIMLPELPEASPIVGHFDGDAVADVAMLYGMPAAPVLALRFGSGAPAWQVPVEGTRLEAAGRSRLVVLYPHGSGVVTQTFSYDGDGTLELVGRGESALLVASTTGIGFGSDALDGYLFGVIDTSFGTFELDLETGRFRPARPASLVPAGATLVQPLLGTNAPVVAAVVHTGAVSLVTPDEDGDYAVEESVAVKGRVVDVEEVRGRFDDTGAVAMLTDEDDLYLVDFDGRFGETAVTVTISGSGHVTTRGGPIDCQRSESDASERGTCVAVVDISSPLTAVPNAGWRFGGWVRPPRVSYVVPRGAPEQQLAEIGSQRWEAVFIPDEPVTADTPILVTSNAASFARACGGRVRAWGNNTLGMFGLGPSVGTLDQPVPIDLPWLDDATSFDANRETACAVRTGGAVWCSGGNDSQVLGRVTPVPYSLDPVQVDYGGVTDVWAGVVVGDGHACSWSLEGTVYCWGVDGTAPGILTPHFVSLPPVSSLTADFGVTCAVTRDTEVWCWGRGQVQLQGVGASAAPHFIPVDPTAPVLVPLTGIVEVATGTETACARTAAGAVLCWGTDSWGNLGNGPAGGPGPTMAIAPGDGGTFELSGAVDIDVTDRNACAALRTDWSPAGARTTPARAARPE